MQWGPPTDNYIAIATPKTEPRVSVIYRIKKNLPVTVECMYREEYVAKALLSFCQKTEDGFSSAALQVIN